MEIKDLVKVTHENAKAKGFWNDFEKVEDKQQLNLELCQRLLLIHGEISEAMEALRVGDMDNFQEEIADTVLRLVDLCGGIGIDLDKKLSEKIMFNKNRPYKHGKAF